MHFNMLDNGCSLIWLKADTGRMLTAHEASLGTDNYFVAEDESFLDATASALDLLTADCKTALRWSHDDADVEAAIRASQKTFSAIVAICKEAGLAVNTVEGRDDHSFAAQETINQVTCTTVESPCFSANRRRESILSWSNELVENEVLDTMNAALYPPPAPIYVSPTQEMVEVELTDLLTQSHKESLKLQRIFEARMIEAEHTREEYEKKQAKEVLTLQEELISSRATMDRIKQELLEDMHSTITASQKTIEAGMREQARYWKSICQELIVEKREMARKVAEERGKYTALKAHFTNHDDAGTDTKAPPHDLACSSGVEQGVDKMHLCESSPSLELSRTEKQESTISVSPCSTSTVVVPYVESAGELSSAEVSPTHSNSSQSSFRRYYLAQKRESRDLLH